MVRASVAVLILVVIMSAGCIGGQTGNDTNPLNKNNTAPTEEMETNSPVDSDRENEVTAVRFVDTEEEPANYSAVLEYDELSEKETTLFENAVKSNGTVRVTNNTTRRFTNLLRELSQPVEDPEGIGGETVDPEVYIERNGTMYRVKLERRKVSE